MDGQDGRGDLEALAHGASRGDRAALDALVGAISDDVYGLAMRMLGHPADAEDATQEILVKVVTHLSGFRGESSLRTWVWRIAANHLVSVRRSRREVPGFSFEQLEAMLDAGLEAADSLPSPEPSPEAAALEEEVKLGCTHAMLLCLDREHRLAFVLSEIYDLTGPQGASVLGIEPAAFRQRVSRARRRMRAFMERTCGLVSEEARCRCATQVGPSVASGLIDPERLVYASHPVAAEDAVEARRAYEAIEGARRYVAVLRSQPRYAAPERVREGLRALFERA
ncbi:MAG TPA: RNA polymerase sigma factor [Candidatus Limnocylindrales bacterium]|nr:RNA polymerase sigma factor [Candidatus Limnocylindrales bacterium]